MDHNTYLEWIIPEIIYDITFDLNNKDVHSLLLVLSEERNYQLIRSYLNDNYLSLILSIFTIHHRIVNMEQIL